MAPDADADRDSTAGVEARIAAGVLLNAALERRGGLDQAMQQTAIARLAPADRAFARAVAMAALRRLGEIDALLATRMQRRPGQPVVTILRVALAQMLVLGTPAFAAVSTAVKAAERDGTTRPFKGLINGVLRGIDREGLTLDGAAPKAVLANLPDWIAARWRAAYGEARLAAMADAGRLEPPTDLSLKPSIDAAALATDLEGVVLTGGTVRTTRRGDLSTWPGYDAGDWWVQDAAAAVAARLLALQPGETALDLCAAPGGKTLQLAAAGAEVVAIDRSAARLKRLEQNLARTGLNAEVIAAPAEDWGDPRAFDAVLLDAPCTATGTYRRNPEVLAQTRPAEIAKLADVQHRLLDVAAARVKPGGRLVYCTCSLEREEGETQIIAFTRRHPEFELVRPDPAAVGCPPQAVSEEGWLRILPSMMAEEGGLDGFFIALMRRKA